MIEFLNKVLLSFLICISISVLLFSQDDVKSNEDIFKELTKQVIDSFLVTIDLNKNDTVNLKFQADDKAKFINEFIIDYLVNQKYYYLKMYANSNLNEIILEYFINKLELSYSKPFREKLFGEKKILRNVHTEISFKFIRNYDVLSYKTISAYYTDTVRYSDVKYLENEMIPLTTSIIPDDSTIEKYILPAITITTVSVIVYLFFIIRK